MTPRLISSVSTPVRSIAGWCATVVLFGVVSLLAACGGGGGGSDGGGGGGGGTNPPGATAPSITTQPQAQTVAVGATATFSVAASGTAPLTYQWSKGGVAISGATSSSYTTPATTAGDSGSSFTVVVSNSAGNVTSSAAALTANTPVGITSQPQAQAVETGDSTTFSVTATGSASLTYQWQKDGASITGATGATYNIPSVALNQAGSYTVVVTNPVGSVTSAAAALTVTANPEGLYAGKFTPLAGPPQLDLFVFVLRDGSAAAFMTKRTVTGEPDVHIGYVFNGVTVARGIASFNSSFTAYTQGGYTFPGGAGSITGTLNGNFIPGVAIQGSITSTDIVGSFQVDLAKSTDGTLLEYERPSSGTLIAGTYTHKYAVQTTPGTDTVATAQVMYDANGTSISPNDSVNCNGVGTFNVPNPAHNAYVVTNTSASCTPPTNGTYVGLMALFPAGTGQVFNGGVNFATDTIVSISDNQDTGYLIISHK
ncbi:MAG: immunoglobulin domain-containing protein [Gammaproteobacteria bacterium]